MLGYSAGVARGAKLPWLSAGSGFDVADDKQICGRDDPREVGCKVLDPPMEATWPGVDMAWKAGSASLRSEPFLSAPPQHPTPEQKGAPSLVLDRSLHKNGPVELAAAGTQSPASEGVGCRAF